MTVQELLTQVKALRSTTFTDEQLVTWLNECEGFLALENFRWPIRKWFPYQLTAAASEPGVLFPDSGHMVLTEPAYLAPGGLVTVDGLMTYADNNGGPWPLLATSDDGLLLTFRPGTFPAIGDTPDSGTAALAYDGTGCELLALPPHDRLYRPYLLAQMAFAQEEWDGYQNYMALYNGFLSEYKKWFNRTYCPEANRCNWRCM